MMDRIRALLAAARRRGWLSQGLLIAAVAAVVLFFASNTANNLARKNLPFGLDFLWKTAGFDIPFKLIDFQPLHTYGRALLVCLLNTVLIAAMAVGAATVLGLLLGLMRLSVNWLARSVAGGLIEIIRNTPQLLQIVFWYVAVMQTLPSARQSYNAWNAVFLNQRGLYLPSLVLGDTAWAAALALILALVAAVAVWRLRARFTGAARRGLALLAPALPLIALLGGIQAGAVTGIEYPVLRGFNFRGGVSVPPELVALWLGLSIYSSAFIAEIVRGAIQGIAHGQTEAAMSLGLKRGQTLRLVILPQALRIIVPPLTSQYLNIIKSSSLGAAIAYPELFQIFAGTVLNQSGRAIETVGIVMVIFLAINLLTSAFMNWYDRKVALKER